MISLEKSCPGHQVITGHKSLRISLLKGLLEMNADSNKKNPITYLSFVSMSESWPIPQKTTSGLALYLHGQESRMTWLSG